MKNYQAPNSTLWEGRADAQADEYLFQIIQPLDLNKVENVEPGFALLGFACDEGVKRNLGRAGAKQGPYAFRQALARLPVHKPLTLYDAGNIFCNSDDLEDAQNSLGLAVKQLLDLGLQPLVIGGGHETAWGHYQGLAETVKDKRFAIVNFDAHFDLRELINGELGSSGTPFKQIALAREKQNLDFNYFCFGIQQMANTKSLFETASQLGVTYRTAQEVNDHNQLKKHQALLNDIIQQHDAIYLTICLDAFAAHLAPGVSAPQPLGLLAEPALSLIKQLQTSGKVISSDIVELSPAHDLNNLTAKLAAAITWQQFF
jgi:formiminoglutamase